MKTRSPIPTRTEQCNVRLSPKELELIEEAARQSGVNRGEFIRDAAKARAARLLKEAAQRLTLVADVEAEESA